MITFDHILTDPEGIHARPAGNLVKAAAGFVSRLTIAKGDQRGDLKRILSVMALGAKCGDTVTITVDGADEEAAADVVRQFLKDNL
ncbi:MAG: HPr family phosphocarrier protein [Propionibacteriaceae bacterium]|jgi:phosphocarrier protein|nr:HPr family phosphocarrier protein [Propionibacteriaceae bacterium]